MHKKTDNFKMNKRKIFKFHEILKVTVCSHGKDGIKIRPLSFIYTNTQATMEPVGFFHFLFGVLL